MSTELAARSAAPFVEIRAVEKSFLARGRGLTAVDGASFDLRAGEFLSVVGPSGCGKSTLMMMVAGLIPVSAGEIVIRGQRVTRPYTDVGVIFQRDALLEWRTVLANVLLQIDIRRLDRGRYEPVAHDLLRRVGLEGFDGYYPWELSGGMRQRVSLCRALIHDPPLLLMDEPFGALDALTREQMVFLLHRIWNETRKSVVFVTHDIQEAVFLADRVLVMTPRPGRIAEEIRVDLRRPRTAATREAPGFLSIVAHIRALFQQTGVLTEAASH